MTCPDEECLDPASDIAVKLWKEEFISVKPEEYIQFLAANDEDSQKIRDNYMDLFEWDENLLASTRILCGKLYLKGESQQIDRILTSFTKSYLKQFPNNVFCTKNFEKIYIIIYSLILLNTALHNSEINKKSKISQLDYIKNTFQTFINQDSKFSKNLLIKQKISIEQELANFYNSLSKNELYLKKNQPDFEYLDPSKSINSPKKFLNFSIAKINEPSIESKNYKSTTFNPDVSGSNPDHSASTTDHSVPIPDHSVSSPDHPVLNNLGSNIVAEDHDISETIVSNSDNTKRHSSSLWSIKSSDSYRTPLFMNRKSSTTSAVSQSTINSSTSRIGFGRALVSGNNIIQSQNSSIKPRQSLDSLRSSNSLQPLNKRTSRTSVISKESNVSYVDDVSVLSLHTVDLNKLQLDDEQLISNDTFENMEDFDVRGYQDQYDLILELRGSPYLKEGLLKLKILNNDSLDNAASQDISSNISGRSTATKGSRILSFFSRNTTNKSNSSIQRSNSSLGTSNSIINKFTDNFVVVSKGELALYSFDPKIIKKHQQKLKKVSKNSYLNFQENVDSEMGDGNWLKNAANIGTYNLCSTFAQLEKSNYHNGKKVVLWSLTFPKINKNEPKKFIFQAGTKEIALEFINTCNFWAAKITAIPTLEESVSSIEYGWNNLDGLINNRTQFKKLNNISKWEPLPKGVYLSNYIVDSQIDGEGDHSGMMRQFVKTYKYYYNLRKLYKEFLKLQSRYISNFPQKLYGGSNYNRIINNFDSKIIEYKADLAKYKSYLIILGFGLQLRFDLEDQDKGEKSEETNDNELSIEEMNQVEQDEFKDDSDLTKLVKFEIKKMFSSMTDINKFIPTYQSTNSINDMAAIINIDANNYENDDGKPKSISKSPKSYTLTLLTEHSSPINQLIQTAEATGTKSYITGTIKEVEEEEDEEEKKEEQYKENKKEQEEKEANKNKQDSPKDTEKLYKQPNQFMIPEEL